MVKHYEKVSNDKRKELIDLIQTQGMSIKEAGAMTGIPYSNAKAINA